MQTIAIANMKGGVAKSTLTFHLAHGLAALTRRVVVIDADYQGDVTAMLGIVEAPGRNVYQVMTGTATARQVVRAIRAGLDLLPADLELANVDAALINKVGRENVLRRALALLGTAYDVALIDCGPSIGFMTANALAAADGVIVPLQPTSTDIRALQAFRDTITDIQAVNARLQVVGTVLTFYDHRAGLHGDAVAAIEAAGLPILARIGRSVKIPEATGAHVPLAEYDRTNPQVEALSQLTQAVNEWLQRNERR